jgi:hypothetical protein
MVARVNPSADSPDAVRGVGGRGTSPGMIRCFVQTGDLERAQLQKVTECWSTH